MKVSSNLIRFSMIGALNTVLDVGIFNLLRHAGWDIFAANMLSTSIGLTSSFLLNRTITFNSQGRKREQVVMFLGITLFGLWVLQPIIIYAFMHSIPIDNLTILNFGAKLTATVSTFVWNYAWYSKKVFKNHASQD